MDQFLQSDLAYVIRLEEVVWGCVLLAVTISIHGAGMFHTMRASLALINRKKRLPGFNMTVLVVVALVFVVLHLIEVMVWAGFFMWQDAQPNRFMAFYNALVNYTTLGAGYLPLRWRLLEGMLGMAGLLSFAFTTSALLTLAQELLRPSLFEQQRKEEAG